MLEYYEEKKALTLQVDASSTGLGALLNQEDQPVAYASKALNANAAKLRPNWKKNFWQCYHVYHGRDVTVEPEHKPLESIMNKSLHAAPLGLQLMLVQLQRFPGIKLWYTSVVKAAIKHMLCVEPIWKDS